MNARNWTAQRISIVARIGFRGPAKDLVDVMKMARMSARGGNRDAAGAVSFIHAAMMGTPCAQQAWDIVKDWSGATA